MAVKNFRIGNDLVVLWAICNRDGSPYNLANKQVRLFVMNERGRKEVVPVLTTLPDGSINNVIRWDFYGMEQRVMGLYTLSVEIFTDEDKKSIKKDYCEAFCLVGSSSLEDEDLADNISDGGELILSSSLDVIQLTIPRIEIGTNGNWIIDGVDTGESALGGGPGLVNNIYSILDFGKEYDPNSVIDTFNAYAINSLYGDIKDTEKDIQDALNAISTLEDEVDLLKQNGGGGSGGSSGGGNISAEQLAAIMDAIGKKADKATTLEGYGITDAYNKTYIDSFLNKYVLLSASHQTIKGDITIEGNLVVKGDMASQGEGNPSLVGASGVIVGATEYRDLNGDGLIDLTSLMALYTPLSSHNSLASRVSTLEGKSTSVLVSQTLTSGKEIGAITIDGVAKSLYAPSTYDWSEIANQPSITVAYGYSASNFEELKWSGRDLLFEPYKYLIADNVTGSPYMTWSIGKLESEFAKYLPLSGGTIKSAAFSPLAIDRDSNSGAAVIGYTRKGSVLGYIGFNDTTGPKWFDSSFAEKVLIHPGNIGDYVIANYKNRGNIDFNNVLHNGFEYVSGLSSNGGRHYGILLSFAISDSALQIVGGRKNLGLLYRSGNGTSDTWGDWKTIAFTDSNVASATKLQTARTLWGKSFDGTADVSGFLYHNGVAFVSPSDSYTTFGSTSRATYIDGSGIWFNASGATNMLINPSGNVLIGTTTDNGAKLQVGGNIRLGAGKDCSIGSPYGASDSTAYNNITFGSHSTGLKYYSGSWTGSNVVAHEFIVNAGSALAIMNNGNVGIGTTSPSAKLHINGDILVPNYTAYKTLDTNGGKVNLMFLGNDNVLRLWDDALYIDANKRIGIGGKSTSAKLHIVGDVRIDGNLIVTGDSASGGTGVVSGGGLDETQLQSYLTANGYINASNIANYALTTAGGTIEGNLDVKTASGSTLKIFSITGSSTAMKQFVYSDASYIESGNSAYGTNMNLYIRGISGKTGNKLYLTYENIYCRGGNYINIDSGNISNYVSGTSGGGAYSGIVTNALEITGISMLIPNGVHTLYVTKTFQLNLRGVTPEDPDKSCVIFLVKKGNYTVTVNPVANSGISLRNAGLAPSSAASVGTYYGIILNWDSESACWIGYVI